MPNHDVIGDVHGSADMLHGLLDQLGWAVGPDSIRCHSDPDRSVIFVGDLIDRGDGQLAVLETVRSMIDAGSARMVMGNHEFNAISYATAHPARPGDHLRSHSPKHDAQHKAFLEQLSADQRAEWIDWFRTLPLWLELDGLRVVHACWHQESIDVLEREFGGATFPAGDEFFVRANTKGDPIWTAIEVILKGPEIELGAYGLPPYLDKGGHVRKAARARWWSSGAQSARDLIDIPIGTVDENHAPYPEVPDAPCRPADRSFSYSDDIPVVYGHHWRRWEPDEDMDWTPLTACVDFSAVAGGHMVAYRWSGEPMIDPSRYVQFPPSTD